LPPTLEYSHYYHQIHHGHGFITVSAFSSREWLDISSIDSGRRHFQKLLFKLFSDCDNRVERCLDASLEIYGAWRIASLGD
jgi:hypothetical protein